MDQDTLNYTTYEPFPSFFAVVLWKRLVGRRVLNTSASTRGVSVRAYAHCHPALDGSVTAVLVNVARRQVSVHLPAALNVSTLSLPAHRFAQNCPTVVRPDEADDDVEGEEEDEDDEADAANVPGL